MDNPPGRRIKSDRLDGGAGVDDIAMRLMRDDDGVVEGAAIDLVAVGGGIVELSGLTALPDSDGFVF